MILFDRETLDGVTTSTYYDPDSDTLHVERSQDDKQILDINKEIAGEKSDWRPWSNTEMVHFARIPVLLIEKWLKEGLNIFDNSPETRKKLMAKLNDPEYRHLRTTPGRV